MPRLPNTGPKVSWIVVGCWAPVKSPIRSQAASIASAVNPALGSKQAPWLRSQRSLATQPAPTSNSEPIRCWTGAEPHHERCHELGFERFQHVLRQNGLGEPGTGDRCDHIDL